MYGSSFEKLLATGDAARRIGLFPQAEQAYREALRVAEFHAPPSEGYAREHLPVAEASVKLGRTYESMQRWDAAGRFFQSALRIYSSVEGDEYFDLALARDHVAVPAVAAWAAAA